MSTPSKRKAGPGRPKLTPANAKSKPVQMRMTEAEKTAFMMAAEMAGLSLSAWMRERLRSAAVVELRKMDKKIPFL